MSPDQHVVAQLVLPTHPLFYSRETLVYNIMLYNFVSAIYMYFAVHLVYKVSHLYVLFFINIQLYLLFVCSTSIRYYYKWALVLATYCLNWILIDFYIYVC